MHSPPPFPLFSPVQPVPITRRCELPIGGEFALHRLWDGEFVELRVLAYTGQGAHATSALCQEFLERGHR